MTKEEIEEIDALVRKLEIAGWRVRKSKWRPRKKKDGEYTPWDTQWDFYRPTPADFYPMAVEARAALKRLWEGHPLPRRLDDASE
jgi:hypothetical protein